MSSNRAHEILDTYDLHVPQTSGELKHHDILWTTIEDETTSQTDYLFTTCTKGDREAAATVENIDIVRGSDYRLVAGTFS